MIKAMTLRTQLMLLHIGIVLVLVLTTGIVALWLQERQIRDAYEERMVAVAQSVAQLPTVVEAYGERDPAATIQPIAELIRRASNLAYVVVTDADGIRFSHPDPDRIGKRVSTEPDALSGEVFVGTQTGTLGQSWRVKVPVFDEDGQVMGQVSVGILEAELWKDFWSDASWMVGALGVATVLGVVASTGIARMVRRRIYGLEPEEIRGLLETREATLHGIREGLLALDAQGRVTLCNDAAATLLGLASPNDATGRQVGDLVDADLSELLANRSDARSLQHLVLAGERVLVASAAPIRVDGVDIGTVVILMDRTELDRALQQLAGAQSMAEGLRAHQHEFANTLHTLGGLLELGETETALRLIERVGDGGAISVMDAHSGIHDIELAALVLAKRSRAKERGISVMVADEAVLPEGAARSSDLVTIVGNLLDNAIDAAAGRVELDIRTSDHTVTITVDDDGTGVDPEDRARVFRLGYTTKPGDRTGDGQRGYGLTLVARAVERLGGAVSVDDGLLGGARFTVSLPRDASGNPVADQGAEQPVGHA